MDQATMKIMARITARADTAAVVREILRGLVGPSRGEAGCVSYELFQNQENPVEFVTIEQWTDQAAADAHMGTPHVAMAISKAGALLALPPLIHPFASVV